MIMDDFDFSSLSKEAFESLIASFTPLEDIIIIFNSSYEKLDKWCKKVYKATLSSVYSNLLAQARFYGRSAITSLAKAGNNTALSILSKYFAKYEEDKNAEASSIPIIAVVPLDSLPNSNNKKGDENS